MLVYNKHLVMRSVKECFVLDMALRMMMYVKYVIYIDQVCAQVYSIHDCNFDIEHGLSIYPVADNIRLS
jgi:hypothetical protein